MTTIYIKNFPDPHTAIAASADGDDIIFESGTIYTLSQTLTGKLGQRWISSGDDPATIRRCDEIKSDLLFSASPQSNSVRVRNPGLFTVGQQVTFVKNKPSGMAHHDDGDIQANWITGIGPTEITLSKPPKVPFAVGDWLITNFPLAVVKGDGLGVENIDLDGNRANNDTYTAWEYQSSLIVQACNNGKIIECEFRYGQGESLLLNGFSGSAVQACTFRDCNGSGIHLSTTKSITIKDCGFNNTNTQAARVVHAEGAITWSWNNKGVRVADNIFDDCKEFAMGRMVAVSGNEGARIEDNRVTNCKGVFDAKGGGDNYTTDGLELGLEFYNNTVANSGVFRVYEYSGKLRNVLFQENRFLNSTVEIDGVDNLDMRDSQLTAFEGPTTAIKIMACNDVRVERNYIDGGWNGMKILTDSRRSYATSRNIVIANNTIRDTLDTALLVGDPVTGYYEDPTKWQTAYADQRDIIVSGNCISSEILPISKPAVYLGKGLTGHGPVFADNDVTSSGVGLFVEGHTKAMPVAASMIRHNTIRSKGEAYKSYVGYDKGIEKQFNIEEKIT